MTTAVAMSVRRPGRRALFPEALADPEGEAAAAIASLRFTVILADRSMTIDLTMLAGRKALARTLAGALWRACQVGGPAGSVFDGLRLFQCAQDVLALSRFRQSASCTPCGRECCLHGSLRRRP
ncbi:hypothetical protein NKI72_20805 [Mesorhizobium sp. M0437]|uniref:hypothetical protein n=1 Tax=Mesorhizobium sp. M0437 TaxID=2956945 RepID=UPI0033384EBD